MAIHNSSFLGRIFDARPSRFKLIGLNALLALLYFAMAKFGLSLAFLNAYVTPVWPPAGLALAAALLWAVRAWPGIFLGAFLANLSVEGNGVTAVAIAFGNMLEAAVGAALIRHFLGGQEPFNTARGVLAFVIFGAGISTLLSAGIGVSTLCLLEPGSCHDWIQTGLTWWLADAAGILIFTPFFMAWRDSRRIFFQQRLPLRMGLFFFLFTVTAGIVFAPLLSIPPGTPIAYILIPFAIWAAFRLGRKSVTLMSVLLMLVSTWGTLRGFGPFVQADENLSLLLLQGFVGVFSLIGLMLASAIQERKRAEESLRNAQVFLENQVMQRTADLRSANAQLHGEIDERRRAEERLTYLANHDTLTQLPNRTLFNERLRQIIAQANRHHRLFAVMFLDLDRFKFINDRFGHDVGDALLQEVAAHLLHCVREGDTVARLGGDEFTLILEGLSAAHDAIGTAQRILHQLSQPYSLHGSILNITPSIGIAVYPEDGEDMQSLLKNADIAMYHAKELGRNNFQFFSANMNSKLMAGRILEQELREALAEGQLELRYQACFDMESGDILGVAASLYWLHPHQGLLASEVFLFQVEDSDLLAAMAAFTLREALQHCHCWRQRGYGWPLILGLTLSQMTKPDFISSLEHQARQFHVPISALCFEIPQQVLSLRPELATSIAARLKALGADLLVTDFDRLDLPVENLKSLGIGAIKMRCPAQVQDGCGLANYAMAKAVITLAHCLDMAVVVASVNEGSQWEFLKNNDCDQAQGEYFAPWLPATAFCDWLHSWHRPFRLRR